MRIGFLLTLCLLAVSTAAGAQAPVTPSAGSAGSPYVSAVERTAPGLRGPRLQIDPNGYERQRLLHARPSLFWPIASLSAGGAVAIGPWLVVGLVAGANKLITPDGRDGHESRAEFRHDLWPLYVYSGIGAAVVLGSAFWLRWAIQKRRTYNQHIRELELAQGPYLLRW